MADLAPRACETGRKPAFDLQVGDLAGIERRGGRALSDCPDQWRRLAPQPPWAPRCLPDEAAFPKRLFEHPGRTRPGGGTEALVAPLMRMEGFGDLGIGRMGRTPSLAAV